MRRIDAGSVGQQLVDLISEPDPLEEDIGIENAAGALIGVVITPSAYEFFLRKVQEEEDRVDAETVEDFQRNRE